MDIVGMSSWIKATLVKVMGSSMFSDGSGNSSCIGSCQEGWEGMLVSYSGDGSCSIMRVLYTISSRSESSVM
jgi:hypothetical protein